MRTVMLCLSLILAFAFGSAARADTDQLAADRVAQAAKVYASLQSATGTAGAEDFYRWSMRWLDAQLDAQPKTASKALADHVKRMQDLETSTKSRYDKGIVNSNDLAATTYFRIEAQLWAARGKK